MSLKFVLDFDGNMARTFDPSPNKIGVNEAYCSAMENLFGNNGKRAFQRAGGLQNRAPIELLKAVQEQGLEIIGSLEDAAEKLVSAKLSILLGEISPAWPMPCLGYAEFNAELYQLRQNGSDIRLAILSSGHLAFIEKTLRMWESQWKHPVFWPDAILSDDDLRHLPIPVEKKVKPSAFLFELIREKMGAGTFIYFGDDPEKDGRLAVAAGVPFGWFAATGNTKTISPEIATSLFAKFTDWRTVMSEINKIYP